MSNFNGETDAATGVSADNILYELVYCSEWKEEIEETTKASTPTSLFSYLSPKNFMAKKSLSIAEKVEWLKNAGPPWQFAVSSDGRLVAILQGCVLETRSIKDSFATILGKCSVTKDRLPGLRRMVWSKDSTLLAISFTNGTIAFYDIMASQLSSVRLYTLPSQEESSAHLFAKENSLVGLFFSTERVKKNSYPIELISVDGKGSVKCYRQTNADQFVFHHEGSFRKHYPRGVNAATLVESNGIIIVSGFLEVDSGMNAQEPSVENGITAWRLLNDAPHYQIILTMDNNNFRLDTRNLWSSALSALLFKQTTPLDSVYKLIVSQDNKLMAALHVTGTISCWHLPSLKLHRSWPLKLQFHYYAENPRFNNRWRVVFNRWNEEQVDDWRFFPYDINWWNENALIVSRVNGCTSLLSLEEELPSTNMLGDSPELFESPVAVSPRYGKGFLCMECEIRLKIEEKRDANGEIIQSSRFDLEMLNASDNASFAKNITQEILFWLTDSERFRPPRRRKRKPPTWKLSHRLISLRRITPLELYNQKIDAEMYGEALDLAKVYNLDPDLVYQRQWSKNTVSLHSINDYLRKITKRNWVLQECLERVPDNIDAARELLQFGLKGTDLNATLMISQGQDMGQFISWTPDDLEIPHEEFLTLVDTTNLEVKLVLKYRKQFLYFLDILDTYELMLGGPRMAEENFDGNVYAKLRSKSPAESAIEMARSNDISGLRIILTHHWNEIAPHYLQVLSSFPETTNPHDYRDFLPEIDRNGEILLWSDILNKETDWCESFLRGDNLDGLGTAAITSELISSWYEERIREIERLSGIVSHALDLARLGIQRNIPGLTMLQDDLDTVEVLVYDVGLDITLDKLEDLGYSERLELLMSTAVEETFITRFRKFIVPFLEKCDEKEPGARFYLLDQYLTKAGEEDLQKVLQIMENSRPGTPNPIVPNLEEVMKLAYNCIYACKSVEETENIFAILTCLPERNRGTASDSINLKEQHDAIDELELHYQGAKILNKYDVPKTLDDIRQITIDPDYEEKCLELFKKLCLAGRLRKPAMKVTEWKTMLYDMLELQKKVFPDFTVEYCFEIYVTNLLKSGSADIINLARDFFDKSANDNSDIPSEGNSLSRLIRRVSSVYSTSFALYLHQIPHDSSLKMVLDAAQSYFDSASSYSDSDIELAKVCLNLTQDLKEPSIAQMFDLIDAVKLLNKDFRMEILPLTVRLCRDKIGLVKTAMDNVNKGYKKIQQLLKLTLFLHPEGLSFEEAESLVLDMAGTAAMDRLDFKFCAQICQNIVAKGYQTGWKIFVQLAKDQSEPPVLDHESKLASINYALNMCPDDEIFNVLNSKCLIEMRSLQSRVAELSPAETIAGIGESFLEEQARSDEDGRLATTPIYLNPLKLHEFVSATSKLINITPVKGVANVVRTGGGMIFESAKTLLKTTTRVEKSKPSGWEEAEVDLDSGQSGWEDEDIDELLDSREDEADSINTNMALTKESYPIPYLNEKELGSPFFNASNFFFKYDSFSDSATALYIRSNPSLELCFIVDKLWHLERNVLGAQESGERNPAVVKQLVLEVLPEDIPLGLGILFSVKEIDTLESIFADFPKTPLGMSVVLYSLVVMIHKLSSDTDNIFMKNPNRLITETASMIEDGKILSEDEHTKQLIRVFNEYNLKLSDVFG